ncbi:MAG: HEAT repeat domain-containing protein, partial [Planctomycetota bacterium]
MRHPALTISAFALLICLSFSSTLRAEGPNPEKEKELIALLRSEAPAADKALACKHLAVHGTANAVPDLARLLENPQLSSWARIALEVIPGPEAGAALRQATNSITGLLLVGTINSIGVRRDAAAVDLLIARLTDADAEVASAAAVALGRIGNAAAAKGLSPLLATAPAAIRPTIAEGMILCAEHAVAAGKSEDAVVLYDQVRKADVHRQRTLEATRGAILARKPDAGIELLLAQLKSNDRGLYQIGLSTAREFPGNAIDKVLAAELSKSAPERAPLLINAMADRKETVVLSAVIKAATEGPKSVRLAAINALSKVGNDSCVTPLLQIGVEKDAELVQAAKQALGELPGAKVNDAIVARLGNAEGGLYPFVIDVIGQRRIVATAELKKALGHADGKVRQAALVALGETIPQKDLGVLISPFLSAADDDEATVAEKALKTACVRMPDAEACATELIAVFAKADVPTQVALLEILFAVGGKNALKTVAASAKSTDADLQDASSRLLG